MSSIKLHIVCLCTAPKIRGRCEWIQQLRNEKTAKCAYDCRTQASYAAYSGIKWAVLTNGMVWQVYHISTGEKIETDLIFTIDLMDGLSDEEALHFYMISKQGIIRKNLLEASWRKIRALSFESILSAILSEDVVSKIRKVLSSQTGYKVNHEELRSAIEDNLLHL